MGTFFQVYKSFKLQGLGGRQVDIIARNHVLNSKVCGLNTTSLKHSLTNIALPSFYLVLEVVGSID